MSTAFSNVIEKWGESVLTCFFVANFRGAVSLHIIGSFFAHAMRPLLVQRDSHSNAFNCPI